MRALKNIDVAFIPMNLPYTMTPEEAADAVRAFKPKVVIPYHYRGQETQKFADALKGSGIEVRLLDWYANMAPGAQAAINSVTLGQPLIERGVEFFKARDAVEMVDGDPWQPTAMGPEAPGA